MKHLTVSDGSSSPAERMCWSLVLVQFLAVLALGILSSPRAASFARCPCPSLNLCHRLPADHQYQVEVIMFDQGGTNWQHYDWSKITTVVVSDDFDTNIVCEAHQNKARVILQAKLSLDILSNQNQRKKWISRYASDVKQFFMDGINLDVTFMIDNESIFYNDLTRMVRDTVQTFHKEIPGSQVSFNAPWSPCKNNRCYDFVEIANACDLLIVASFDVQSFMMDECFAKANAPYVEVFTGLLNYIRLGIDSKKLIMGVPWFGYDYLCEQYFEDPGEKYHEVWYDDPESISLKSSILKKLKLRGISMSSGNYLNYSTDPLAAMQTEQMWNALCPF
ncbi:di-N-acetylchitobiase-like [Hemiscyllium ocellatum]|uniref:di-N-acetylchitobiase-like n=1 Tax=Hemiscyllium ocellatum TaxID=170820 RepID=UPI00296647D3|nr:di-N-acetylchitobiase-like [Hemiscyllium ocellatum]